MLHGRIAIIRGVSKSSQTGGPSESFILAASPPPVINLAPFFPGPLRGAPACALMAPYSSCWFIFFFLFSSFVRFSSLFLSLCFPFSSFWRSFSDREARPPKPPRYAPDHHILFPWIYMAA